MIATAPQRPVVQHVETTLQQLRKGNLHHGVRFAAVTAIAVLSVIMLLAIALDWYFGWLSSGVRWLISLTAWGVTLSVFAAVAMLLLRSRRQQSDLAQQADSAAPLFEERLQTIVGIQSRRIPVDRQMMQMVLSETESLYEQNDPAELAQRQSSRTALAAIAACGMLLVGMFALQTRDTSVLLARFFWPSTTLTRTTLAEKIDDQVVGTGESWTLSNKLVRTPVSTVLLEQRLSPTETIHRDLNVAGTDGDEFRFMIARAKESFAYRLTAGDYRSDWSKVIVTQRPKIVRTELLVIPPAYTGRKPTHITKIPRELTVFKGSTVRLSVRAEAEIERAEWILQPDKGTRSMFAEDDGFLHCSIKIDESVHLTPRLVETHGLENKQPRVIRIRAIEDKPPTVKINKPSPDTAVRPDDTIRIEFDARDDIGIKRAELVLYKTDQETGKSVELHRIPHAIDPEKNQRRVRGAFKVDLSKLELKHGDTINYRVEAYDRKQLGSSSNTPDIQQPKPIGSKIPKPKSSETAEDPKESGANEESESIPKSATDKKPSSNAASEKQNGTPKDKPDDRPPSNPANSDPKQGNPPNPSSASSSNTPSSKPSNSETPKPSEQDAIAKLEVQRDGEPKPSDPKPNDPKPPMTADPKSAPDSGPSKQSGSTNEKPENQQPNKSGNSNSKQGKPSNPSSTSSGTAPKPSEKDDEDAKSKMQVPLDRGPQPSRRLLDVIKPSSSAERQLKIDQYSGSFAGQARRKLEIAIAPVLANLKKWLTATDELLGSVQDTPDQKADWGESEHQSLSRAVEYLDKSYNAVDELTSRTNGTPYAFVGLQISDIAITHLEPARSDALAALKTSANGRNTLVDNSRIQVQRALARLEDLTKKFEREKREQLLAEKIQEFEKVYRIYVENTMAKLQAQRDRINRMKREGVEFDLDEEYLKRLQEVLEMRRDLEAELARILSEDPRLLKRFSQSSRGQADNLRDQFSLLARRQFALTSLAGQLAATGDDAKNNGIEFRTLEVAFRLAGEFGDAADRFDTWMPLNAIAPTPEVTAAIQGFRVAASQGERLRQSVIQQAQGIENGPADYTDCLQRADDFESSLGDLRQRLIAMGSNSSNDEYVSNAGNRLAEISKIRNKLLGWRFQIEALAAGRRAETLAVDQHQLMIELHEYTDKMSTLPRQIATLIPESDGTVPAKIARLSNSLLSKIDTGIEPTQLASTLALRKEEVDKAIQRMKSVDAQFKEAEEIFDQLMIAIVEILDQLPVNDPIASLLNDPTLEEILAQLERESSLNELLGIPNRPSNLRVLGDWMNAGGRNGSSGIQGQGIAGMVRRMMASENRKRQKSLQKFREKLLAESEESGEASDGNYRNGRKVWRKVVSELDDGLIQQRNSGIPEYYRSAIQQYFETLSSK